MAPLRNRAQRTQGDDEASILKGLPIHQWRQTEQHIGPPSEPQPTFGKQSWPELPMPRDSHLLPDVSQQLLRAARAGKLYQQPASLVDDDDEKDNGLEEEEQKETPQGFYVRKWTQLPRHLEQPEPEHLAKRRKGLPPTFGGNGVLAPPAALREIKVKKVDGEGNVSVYKMLVAEGQTVEGELVPEDETLKAAPVEAAVAPGTVVEGLGVVNEQGVVVANDLLPQPTPPRRKPPPKRKPKKQGPGRGKKKVLFEAGTEGGVAGTNPTSGTLQVPGSGQADGGATSTVPSSQGDTPMRDPQEGDEEDSSGSEASEDGDEDREEGELSPTPEPELSPSRLSQQPPTAANEDTHKKSPTTPTQSKPETLFRHREASSSPELPLATKISHSRQGSLPEMLPSEPIPIVPTIEEPTTTEKDIDTRIPELESAQIHINNTDTKILEPQSAQIESSKTNNTALGDLNSEDTAMESSEIAEGTRTEPVTATAVVETQSSGHPADVFGDLEQALGKDSKTVDKDEEMQD